MACFLMKWFVFRNQMLADKVSQRDTQSALARKHRMKEITNRQAFEMGGQVAEKLTQLGADGDKVQSAIEKEDHPFWSDLAKHFGQKIKSVLRSLGKVVAVPATEAKPTADCFTNQARYYYRDDDLDKFLPKNQSAQDASQFAVCELTETATFQQVAESVLGVSGDIQTLSKLLIQHGHTTSLLAIEALIKRQESGEDVGLLTNGWANFFLVENKDGSVSVVCVHRLAGGWSVLQSSFGCGYGWAAGRRFFFRNFLGTL